MIARRIYVASSWRNKRQAEVITALRADGHEVYDFRHPWGGDQLGFSWANIDHEWQMWSRAQYRESLHHPIARAGFASDVAAMKWADACVLVLPCGRSAHLELGWMAAAGKQTIVLMEITEEPELMYALCDSIALTLDEVLVLLRGKGGGADKR